MSFVWIARMKACAVSVAPCGGSGGGAVHAVVAAEMHNARKIADFIILSSQYSYEMA
jgi:hypothetical protein